MLNYDLEPNSFHWLLEVGFLVWASSVGFVGFSWFGCVWLGWVGWLPPVLSWLPSMLSGPRRRSRGFRLRSRALRRCFGGWVLSTALWRVPAALGWPVGPAAGFPPWLPNQEYFGLHVGPAGAVWRARHQLANSSLIDRVATGSRQQRQSRAGCGPTGHPSRAGSTRPFPASSSASRVWPQGAHELCCFTAAVSSAFQRAQDLAPEPCGFPATVSLKPMDPRAALPQRGRFLRQSSEGSGLSGRLWLTRARRLWRVFLVAGALAAGFGRSGWLCLAGERRCWRAGGRPL